MQNSEEENALGEITALVEKGDVDGAAQFLNEKLLSLLEAGTGLWVSEGAERKLLVGQLAQGILAGDGLKQFARTFKQLREKGHIKEAHFATRKYKAALVELLKFIEDEVPDEEVLDAMQNIFFAAITKDPNDHNSIFAYEMLKVCKDLTSGEILVMRAEYEFLKPGRAVRAVLVPQGVGDDGWLTKIWIRWISDHLGLPKELVELSEDGLIRKRIFNPREVTKDPSFDKAIFSRGIFEPSQKDAYASTINPALRNRANFPSRLTHLGESLCKYITHDPLAEAEEYTERVTEPTINA